MQGAKQLGAKKSGVEESGAKKLGTDKLNSSVRSLLWLGAVALIGAAGVFASITILSRPVKPVLVSLVTAARDNIESTINESGTVELREQKTLKSPTEGTVETILVKLGQRVKSGQILLTLRYPEQQTVLADQRFLIQQQELTLTRNQQRVLEAREQLSVEERKLKQLADLVTQGAIGQQRFQDQENQVRQAKIAGRDAEAAVATSKIELQRLRLEQKRIQQQLQNRVITSPIDAVVLDVKVKAGEGVEPRTELLTLGDPNQEYVHLRLSALDATRVRINQLARVTAIGSNPQVFTGRVQKIYFQEVFPEQAKQGSSRRQSEQASVPAVVKLDKPSRSLIPGSQVNVEIILEQARNVVTIRTEAVQRNDGQPFVWILDNDQKAQKRLVSTGLEGLINIEISSGLDPNERVILPPSESPLRPGMPVTTK